MDITQRSHDLIERLERKFIAKQNMANRRQHHTPMRDQDFIFPELNRHTTFTTRGI